MSFTSEGANQTQTVTATDIAGNSRTFVSPAVRIDTTAPAITATSNPPSTKIGTKPATVNISGTVADALSGVNRASGTYRVTNGGGTQVTTGTLSEGGTGTYSFKVSNLPASKAATYTIAVSAADVAGVIGTAATTFVRSLTGHGPSVHPAEGPWPVCCYRVSSRHQGRGEMAGMLSRRAMVAARPRQPRSAAASWCPLWGLGILAARSPLSAKRTFHHSRRPRSAGGHRAA